jgi:hypothetical protein
MAKCFVRKCENTAVGEGEINHKSFRICDEHYEEVLRIVTEQELQKLELFRKTIVRIRNLGPTREPLSEH